MKNNLWFPVVSAPADDPSSNPGSGAGGGGGGMPSMAEVFGGSVTVNDPPAASASPDPATAPGGAPPAPPAAPAAGSDSDAKPDGWTLERFFAERYPEKPEWLKDEKGVTEWKSARELSRKQLETISELSGRELTLKQEIAALKAGLAEKGGATLPETEAVKKLQLELADFQKRHETELGEWQAHKAKNDLASNPAFMAEFDGRRAVLHEEASEIAQAAGVDGAVVEAVFGAKNEYDLVKALAAVEDETAAALLKEKGRAFLGLTKQKELALKGPNVTEELKRWRDYEQSMQGALTARFSDALKQQFTAALPIVAEELAKGDVFFATESGKATMAQISQRFSQGIDLKPDEVVRNMALAASAPVYRQVAEDLGKKLAEAQKLLARYGAADPSQVTDAGGLPGSGVPENGLLSGMFSGLMKR
jgi:hypothetical protein